MSVKSNIKIDFLQRIHILFIQIYQKNLVGIKYHIEFAMPYNIINTNPPNARIYSYIL